MQYIVLDLEWNQASADSDEHNSRLPFEIIEIGAVKLDEKFKIIDKYQSIIRPQIYLKLQENVRNMLNYDERHLNEGRYFNVVASEFIKWCGKEYMFCTWGTEDLVQLQRNLKFNKIDFTNRPFKYYDLQMIFNNQYKDTGILSLEKVVGYFGIHAEKPFHSAINDAEYTAEIFMELNKDNLDDMFSVDYYCNPKSKDKEITFLHKTYCEYISSEYRSKAELMEDKDVRRLQCFLCNKRVSRKLKWFSSSNSIYYSIAKCKNHGYLLGKIKVKQNDDNMFFAVKTVSTVNMEAVKKVKKRQEEIRRKKRQKSIGKKVNNCES